MKNANTYVIVDIILYLLFVKKGKFTLEQAMKDQRGNRGIVLLFL
jgi:hypothetical protein